MIINDILTEINITGSILSRTSDNILIPSLSGSFNQLPLILHLCNPKNRIKWYKREYSGTTTPTFYVNIIIGSKTVPITTNQLYAFVEAVKNANLDFIDFNEQTFIT